MIGGKAARIFNALHGMVAAAAFGDIVKEGGQIENIGLVKRMHQRRGHRQFVAVGIHCQPAHIAQHHQNVVVHRVNVE